jgi:hypothetical protein
MSRRRTIVERFLSGDEYDLGKIDDEIDAWHGADTDLELPEWLGLTADEYALYVEHPQAMRIILAARRRSLPVKQLLRSGTATADLAARGASPTEIRKLEEWLKATGRL